MKFRNLKFTAAIMVLVVTSLYSCASTSADGKVETKHATTGQIEIENGQEPVKTVDIIFKSGKIIEIAYATVRGGKEMELQTEYFAKILPIAAKYGAKMLGSLQVTAITGGEIHPQMIALFEWPNLEAKQKLFEDEAAKKLFPIRDAALTSLKMSYYTVPEDITVTFREDKTYEFFNAWLTPEAKTALPEYFKQSDASKQNYGPPVFLADLKPFENSPKEDYVLRPHMTGIVEWSSTAAFYGLSADPEFQKATPLLEKSLTRIDMIHAKFNFPE